MTEFIFSKAEKHPYFSITLLLAFLLLLPGFIRPIYIPDEGRYAEVARETLIERNWLVPHLNGVPHITKPPLYYGLTAFFLFVFGIHVFSMRLVSICAFLCGLFFCIRFSRKREGLRAGFLAGLIGATIFQSAAAAQFADLNTLFTFWLTAGLLLFFNALENPARKASWYASWIFFALAFLTKGPPALVIVLGTILIYRLISNRRFPIPVSQWIWGVLLHCAIAFPWYIWVYLREGEKLTRFWYDEVFRRTALGERKWFSKPGYYIPVFLVGGAGWTFLAVSKIIAMMKSDKNKKRDASQAPGESQCGYWKGIFHKIRQSPHDQQWLLSWIAASIIPFSIVFSSMVSYIQPSYPPLAIFLALWLVRRSGERDQFNIRKTLFFSVALFIIVVWGWSVLGFMKTRSFSSRFPIQKLERQLESSRINLQLRNLENESYTLFQFDYFSPVFNFENHRYSALVEEWVNTIWPPPCDLIYTVEELRHEVLENRLLTIILRTEDVHNLTGEGWENLRVCFRGKHLTLLVSKSLEDYFPRTEFH